MIDYKGRVETYSREMLRKESQIKELQSRMEAGDGCDESAGRGARRRGHQVPRRRHARMSDATAGVNVLMQLGPFLHRAHNRRQPTVLDERLGQLVPALHRAPT